MAITNPLVPYDPKDQTSRATILILQNAGVADTVALAVAEANALLVKDGDQPHGLWTFETEDAEDGGTMTVHNAFADERSGSWNVTLSPGKDFWLLMDPARSYGDDYIRWRDGTLKVLQTDRAPPLLPASVP
jgi:hypothetical protein